MQLPAAEPASGAAGGAPLLPSSASSRPQKGAQQAHKLRGQGQLTSCLAALRYAMPSSKKAAMLKGKLLKLAPPSSLASLQHSLEQASLLAQLPPCLAPLGLLKAS